MDKLEFVKFMRNQGYECNLDEQGLPIVRFHGEYGTAKELKRTVKRSGYNASWGIVYAKNADD